MPNRADIRMMCAMATTTRIDEAPPWNQNGSTEEVQNRKAPVMPVTITLKNIPESLYERLKEAAQRNHRSLNGEVLERLQDSVGGWQALSVEERLERIRAARVTLKGGPFDLEELDRYINEGRP